MLLIPLMLLAGTATVFAEGQCASCNLTLKAEIRTSEVLSSIKAKLGFDPAVTRKIPAEVMAKAEAISRHVTLQSEKDDLEAQEAVHVFASEDDDEDSNAARFHFHNDTRGRSVRRADLHLYLAKPEANPEERREVSINVYEAVEDGEKGELIATHRVLTPAHEHTHHKIRLNSAAVERLAQKDATTLVVEAIVDGENLVVLPGDDDEHNHPLSLALELTESRRVRRSRMNECKENASVQSCCVFSHVVDMHELGWDFVVAPSKIFAMGCAGYCPGRDTPVDKREKPTREGVLESMGLSQATCCHPTSYEDMQIIYITPNNNIVVSFVKDMFVTRCGCS